jgi:transcriptional regulator with XRE-family HTH domain
MRSGISQGTTCELGDPLKTLGRIVRHARRELDLTQLALAAELGMTTAQPISELERGKRAIPLKYLDKLTGYLGLEKNVILELIILAGGRAGPR